ncbi:MAG: nitrate/nitrite transporter NrtS [Cyanobacteria bacterium P01_F01_bin.143]
MKALREYIFALINPKLASTAVRVAMVVGSILFTINHGSALIQGEMTNGRWVSGIVTYMVPYMVSVHGQYTGRSRRAQV